MANPEHLEILKQGVDAWNAWRAAHPEVKPDPYYANLFYYGKLPGCNLSDSNLSHATLSDVDLYHANLSRADLTKANLS